MHRLLFRPDTDVRIFIPTRRAGDVLTIAVRLLVMF